MRKRLIGSGVACVAALCLLTTTTAQGQDLTTQLSKFLADLASGTLGGTVTFATLVLTGSSSAIQLGGTTASFPELVRSSTSVQVKLADGSGFTTLQANNFQGTAISNLTGGVNLINFTAPTISSGFGTSPSILSSNGTASFRVNVGTGGTATSGVIGLPAASNGWNCFATDMTTNVVTRMTASTTTTATFTAASAWTASDILGVSCFAY
jgi:hypothetical protein